MTKAQGYAPYCLTVAYGQRHAIEIDASRRVAASLGAEDHRIVGIDLRAIGGSALTDTRISVPKDEPGSGIPVTYVPARNAVFLAIALGYAEVVGSRDLFIGANAVDYSGYPDCRPEFVAAFETLANVATKAGAEGSRFRVHAPLMRLSKAEIIREGLRLGVDYGLTVSCYDPGPNGPCGACESCRIRSRAFREVGVPDPAANRSEPRGPIAVEAPSESRESG
jgi:7-cyano-7-deazaguanine synthase